MSEPKFVGDQIYFAPRDKAALYLLVSVSDLPPAEKDRLSKKLAGDYLNQDTKDFGDRQRARSRAKIVVR